jgi:hypothetical protein
MRASESREKKCQGGKNVHLEYYCCCYVYTLFLIFSKISFGHDREREKEREREEKRGAEKWVAGAHTRKNFPPPKESGKNV